jgi:nucleotide-binding universal stress UspA family protein
MAVDKGSPSHSPTFLVPTDLSEHAGHAYRIAASLVREGNRLCVLHVVGAVSVASEGYEEALKERLREHAPPVTGVDMEYRLAEGDAAEEILRAAEATKSDTIVIASHGRTGLQRLLMGSVAEKVARSARCHVLIVRKCPA